jgi:hypothetical protein
MVHQALANKNKIGLSEYEYSKIIALLRDYDVKIYLNSNCQANIVVNSSPKQHDGFLDNIKYGNDPKSHLNEKKYVIGYSNNQYWIRWQNGKDQSVLHYDRKTGEYGFIFFEEMMKYFMKFFTKKYSNLKK